MAKRRFAVLGLGQMGEALARELCGLGCEVLVVDISAKKIEHIRDSVAMAAVADVRERGALEELFTSPFDSAVIAIGGSIEAAIMATLHLKEMGVKEVWAEGSTPEHARLLERIGADRVISPEHEMGRRLAQRLANPDLVEYLPLTKGYGVVEVAAPSWAHGKTLGELQLRAVMRLAVIAIRAADGNVTIIPGAEAKLDHGDVLTLVGRDADLAKFRERK